MWTYNKTLQYPINIKCPDPRLAKVIISQYGGPDGELAASLRYLSQRFAMPDQNAKAILNDIGTEELAHLEMVGTIVHQLTKNASIEEIRCLGFAIVELAEYLDTHVDDEKALCLHREYATRLRDLKDKYQKVYGPLTITFPCNKWRWIEEPWPWERGNF